MVAKRRATPPTAKRKRSSSRNPATAAPRSKSPPLLALISRAFDALRTRVRSSVDSAAPAISGESKNKAATLGRALDQLQADYERVLKRE